MSKLDGFLNINKPKNWTSFDVIAKLRSITGIKKIGHAGTLDPFATGVLVVAVNQARFLIDFVQKNEKIYRGRIRLGQISDTDDVDGSKTTIDVSHKPDTRSVELALSHFVGGYDQVPPKYAALKVKGRKMYEMARAGEDFEPQARRVEIHDLKLLSFSYPYVDIEAKVGSGTYIRALARDLGEELGTGAFLEELVRHSVGPFELEDSLEIGDISLVNLPQNLHPLVGAIGDMPRLILGQHELEKMAHGQTIVPPTSLIQGTSLPNIAILNSHNHLLMLANYDRTTNRLKSKKIFDESLRR